MSQCKGTTKSGLQCSRPAKPGIDYCSTHQYSGTPRAKPGSTAYTIEQSINAAWPPPDPALPAKVQAARNEETRDRWGFTHAHRRNVVTALMTLCKDSLTTEYMQHGGAKSPQQVWKDWLWSQGYHEDCRDGPPILMYTRNKMPAREQPEEPTGQESLLDNTVPF